MSSLPPSYPQGYPPSYAPAAYRRPGIISAIGVISIILGVAGILANSIVFLMLMSLSAISRVAKSAPPPPAAVAPAAPAGEYVAPRGMRSDERQVVIQGLYGDDVPSDARRQQLDALLADAGRDILPMTGPDLTVERVKASVTEHRRLPSATDEEPIDKFVLGFGSLEVSDHNAVFRPTSGDAIHVQGGSVSDPVSGQQILGANQIQAVLNQIQKLDGKPLNSAQQEAISSELARPGERIVLPGPSVAAAVAQVKSASVLSDGSVAIVTDSNTVSFSPDGTISPGITTAAAAAGMSGSFPVSRRLTAVLTLCTAASIGLAVLLLVVGLFVLKGSPTSRRVQMIWAGAKIILVLATAFAWYRFWAEVTAGNATGSDAGIVAMVVGGTMVLLVYPVAVLIALNSRGTRDYFTSGQ